MKELSSKLVFFFCITLLFGVACTNEEKESDALEEDLIEFDSIEENGLTDTISSVYMLPSPLRIANLFKQSGLHYIGGITNPYSNSDNYNSRRDLTLNFGVYSADMAYCMINNQSQELINYINSLRELSEKLWLTDLIENFGVYDRVERNIDNVDSLLSIVSEIQIEVDTYMEENGMDRTGVIIFAGAWIETMNLAVKVIESDPENELLISKLSEQSVVLDNLRNSIIQYDKEKNYQDLVTDLEEINENFNGLTVKTEDGFNINQEKLDKVTQSLLELRKKIVDI